METLRQSPVRIDTPPEANGAMTSTLAAMGEVLEQRFGIDAAGLALDRHLDTLGLDSLSFVEYAFELEKRLGIVLPDLPRDLVTVGDLARLVQLEVDAHAHAGPAG